ncbi:MAG: hypothetical protein ACD_43C00268G0001 [uncultured bacterium]|nr:MAG: hypothetical protein ACD_43C00268G0001 [uncultured bacterium]
MRDTIIANMISMKKRAGVNKKIIIIIILTLFVVSLIAILFWWIDRFPTASNYQLTQPAITQLNKQQPIEKNINISASWVYVNDAIKLLVTPSKDVATCDLVWTGRGTEKIGFYTWNNLGEKRIIAAEVTNTDCNIKEDISDLDYLGFTIDDKDAGGLEKPTNTGSMHMLYSLPDNPTTVYPTTGQWNYQMTANAGNLNCDLTLGHVSASGLVNFTTTDYGMAGTLTADTGSVYFMRSGYANPHYESPSYSFPTQSTYGTVSFELDVVDQEIMTGWLHMQGAGCAGDFPISMNLQTPTGPPIYVPHQGYWLLQYTPFMCDSTPVETANLFGMPLGSANLSVTGGGPAPMNLFFGGTPGSLNLNQTFETNLYSSFPNMYLGTALDVLTHQPFIVMGTWNVSAISDTQLFGTLMVNGSNGCSGASNINFTAYY